MERRRRPKLDYPVGIRAYQKLAVARECDLHSWPATVLQRERNLEGLQVPKLDQTVAARSHQAFVVRGKNRTPRVPRMCFHRENWTSVSEVCEIIENYRRATERNRGQPAVVAGKADAHSVNVAIVLLELFEQSPLF